MKSQQPSGFNLHRREFPTLRRYFGVKNPKESFEVMNFLTPKKFYIRKAFDFLLKTPYFMYVKDQEKTWFSFSHNIIVKKIIEGLICPRAKALGFLTLISVITLVSVDANEISDDFFYGNWEYKVTSQPGQIHSCTFYQDQTASFFNAVNPVSGSYMEWRVEDNYLFIGNNAYQFNREENIVFLRNVGKQQVIMLRRLK